MFSFLRKNILFILLLIFVCSATLVCLSSFGNGRQPYTDIVAEFTSLFESNKSLEIYLLFILIFCGLIIITLYHFFYNKAKKNNSNLVSISKKNHSYECVCFIGLLSLFFLIIRNDLNILLYVSLILSFFLYIIDKKIVFAGLVSFFVTTYAIVGIIQYLNFIEADVIINTHQLLFSSLIISLFPLFCEYKKILFYKWVTFSQIFIPFVLLIVLKDRYRYQDEIIQIPVYKFSYIFIFSLVFLFFTDAITKFTNLFVIKRSSFNKIINYGTCVSILLYNSYGFIGSVMSSDMHHPFEEIIGYSQIFELGVNVFSQYVPTSGLYSVVKGWFFSFWGNGLYSNFNVACNIFYLCVIMLFVYLLRKHTNSLISFLIVLLFNYPSYSRIVFVLPIILLLTLPRLIEKKVLWLQIWFLTSLFHGLYYPLNGVGVLLGTLPLGIYQIITYVKSKNLKTDVRTFTFWVGWLICLISFVLCLPLLVCTFKFILIMSDQTIMADGLSKFGQFTPSCLLSYINGYFKVPIHYALYFVIPCFTVYLTFYIALNYLKIKSITRFNISDNLIFCILCPFFIFLIISFTYTFVRLDPNPTGIFSRDGCSIYLSIPLLLIFLYKYKEYFLRKYVIVFLTFLFGVIGSVGSFALMDGGKLNYYINVPENYLYVKDSKVKKIGEGFVDINFYNNIQALFEKYKDKNDFYYAPNGDYGSAYLLSLKGVGTISHFSVRSSKASQKILKLIKDNYATVGNLNSFEFFYIVRWLMTSGEYVWYSEKGEFLPRKMFLNMTDDEVIKTNKLYGLVNPYLFKTPSSWGNSMNTLSSKFSSIDVSLINDNPLDLKRRYIFNKAIDGLDAEFIYVEFKDVTKNFEYTLYDLGGEKVQNPKGFVKRFMKKNFNPGVVVRVSWFDDDKNVRYIDSNLSKGKLLIPLGAGAGWLLNKHNEITISVLIENKEIPIPEISKIELLKLNDLDLD